MFIFKPEYPHPLKTAAYESIKSDIMAQTFLDWCRTLMIESKDKGAMNFNPNAWYLSQWIVISKIFNGIKENKRWFKILKSRQLGITTILLAFDLFYSFQHNHLKGAIVSCDYSVSSKIRQIIRTLYDNVPPTKRYRKVVDNANAIIFKNKSSLQHLFTTDKNSKKGNMGRSGAINFLHGTETAFLSNVEDYNSFISSLSDVYKNRLYILESTANSYNHWYEMCEIAKNSSEQVFIFIGFWGKDANTTDNPRTLEKYGYPLNEWEKAQAEIVYKEYGIELTMNQIAWWRQKLTEEMSDRGDLSREDMMLQENPWTADDCFRTSGKNFFQQDAVASIEETSKNVVTELEPIFTKKCEETIIKPIKGGKIKIYEEPEEGCKYVLGADPSYGSNPDSDNGVITIYNMFSDKMRQVCEYADNMCDSFHFTWLILSLAGMYNIDDTGIILELNGPGNFILQAMDMYRRTILDEQTADPSKDYSIYKYARRLRREYLYKRVDSLGTPGARQWKSTSATKTAILYQFQTLFHNGEIEINSRKLAQEMRTIVQNGDEIGAISGKHDDRVIASALCAEYWMKDYRITLPTEEMWYKNRAFLLDEQKKKEDPVFAYNQYFLRNNILAQGQTT